MNQKAFIILVAIAAILVVLAIVGQRPSGTGSVAGDSAGELLLPALTEDLDSIEEIRLDGAGRERLVSIERSGSDWIVAELDGYRADRSAVGSLLIALAEARIVEEKTASPEFHSRLGVEAIDDAEAAGVELGLVAADGDSYSIVLGASYGSGQRYARIADQNLSVLIDRDPEIESDPSDWVVREIIDIASNRVQRIEISHADGERVTIYKENRGDANFSVDAIPEGRELQYAGVANVTGNLLQGLTLDDVRRRRDDSAEPVSVTEFSTFDGLVVSVTATSVDDDDVWLAFSADFDPPDEPDAARDVQGRAQDDAEAEANSDSESQAEGDADARDNAEAQAERNAELEAEAEAINARLADWQFRIPSYQLSQLTRRMDDLLAPQADE